MFCKKKTKKLTYLQVKEHFFFFLYFMEQNQVKTELSQGIIIIYLFLQCRFNSIQSLRMHGTFEFHGGLPWAFHVEQQWLSFLSLSFLKPITQLVGNMSNLAHTPKAAVE